MNLRQQRGEDLVTTEVNLRVLVKERKRLIQKICDIDIRLLDLLQSICLLLEDLEDRGDRDEEADTVDVAESTTK